jgi:hypothetical protein
LAEPTRRPTAGSTTTTSAPAPATVVIGDARVNDSGVTETPAVTATPPPGSPAAGDADVYVFVGPARVDCTQDGQPPSAWEESCRTLAQMPIPSLRTGANED